jgi:drug/metabolite transporter (DMT)-like permease
LIYLLLSILSATMIFVIFKLFSRYEIDTLNAIVVNYIVACFSGLIAFDGIIIAVEIPHFSWFYYTLGLGAFFIIVFNLMALTTQRCGLSVASVATKMSLTIPIVFGLLYYKEQLGIFNGLGIVLALIAVYLASVNTSNGPRVQKNNLVLPLLVFLGSGIIDTSIKFLEESFVAENDIPLFSATIFGSAAGIGILVLVFQKINGKFKFKFKNIIGGILLGVPNYFSIYFLVKALRSGVLESSGIFTVNNVGVVLISTFAGILLFKEKLLPKNWLGVILAILSIFFVALARIQ